MDKRATCEFCFKVKNPNTGMCDNCSWLPIPEIKPAKIKENCENCLHISSELCSVTCTHKSHEPTGKVDAIAAIKNIGDNEDGARLLVRICCAIGSSDGSFDDDEKNVVHEMCKVLGLNPSDFSL